MKRFAIILLMLISLAVVPAAIKATEGARTELHQTDAPMLLVGQGKIELQISTNTTYHFHIFSITGQIVKTVQAGMGTTTVELPAGCYIVKCEKWSKKIVVR